MTELEALAVRLEQCPDINHARLVLAQRETEYIVPASLKFAVIKALRALAQEESHVG